MKRPHRVERPGTPPKAPAATRARRGGWRDPKVALGLLLIGSSVLLGAKIVGQADETVGVWALAHDVSAGARLTTEDLISRQVKLPEGAVERVYLTSDRPPADHVVAAHALAQGELLARAAVAQESTRPVIEVPLQVGPGALPSSIEEGTAVDIWVIAGAGTGDGSDRPAKRASRVVEDATLLSFGDRAEALSGSTDREILIGVAEDREDSVAELLGALQDGRVVVTRRSAGGGDG